MVRENCGGATKPRGDIFVGSVNFKPAFAFVDPGMIYLKWCYPGAGNILEFGSKVGILGR